METNDKVALTIDLYSQSAKDKIYEISSRSVKQHGLESLQEDLFSCIDELIKNAVKANYKYLLIKNELIASLKNDNPNLEPRELKDKIKYITRNTEKFSKAAQEVLGTENISKQVRTILNEESRYLDIKNKTYKECREPTKEEQEQLHNLKLHSTIRNLAKEHDVKVSMDFRIVEDFIFIEIKNSAPMLPSDMERIHHKRTEFRNYRIQNREHEFFINNLDTSDSGFGLGYAIIDSHLAQMGLEPMTATKISSNAKTSVSLFLPVDTLKRFAS